MFLEVRAIESSYDQIPVLSDVTLNVLEGELVTVIGSNGSGKSTLLKSISGHLPPRLGQIIFGGQEVTGLSPWQLISLGMVLVPEGRHLFGGLSVEENLFLGTFPHRKSTSKIQKAKLIETVYELFPRLRERKKQVANTLSGGEQQMLAVGRGLVSKPKMFLLDEPSLGLAPLIKKEIFQTLANLHEQEKMTILLVEQDVKGSLGIADRAYIMQTGRIVREGNANQMAGDSAIQEIYLGRS